MALNVQMSVCGQNLTAPFNTDFTQTQIGANFGTISQMAFALNDDNHFDTSTFGTGSSSP
jgi:hypothetical protein